eukprot:680401-Pleurochrysis_carterae.AAC.1
MGAATGRGVRQSIRRKQRRCGEHPDVVGAGRPHTASELYADPSSRVHASFGVGGARLHGEGAATKRKNAHDAWLFA